MDTTTGEIQDTTNRAALFAKMARVMGKMSRIQKTGENTQQHYKFATESDIVDMVRTAMAEENLAFLPVMIDVEGKSFGDKGGVRWKANFLFTFADGETGATYSCPWIAESIDYGDKGVNKVATAAVKYFLLKTFLISTGDKADDADNDSVDMRNQKPATPKRQSLPADEIQAAREHQGTGTDGRRIPAKSNKNGASSAATDGKVIPIDGKPQVVNDAKIEALDKVTAEEYIGKGGKKGIRFKTSTGSYSYTRKPFQEYMNCDEWTKPGTYTFDGTFNVISKWHQPEDPTPSKGVKGQAAQGYWRIDKLDPVGADIFPISDDAKSADF